MLSVVRCIGFALGVPAFFVVRLVLRSVIIICLISVIVRLIVRVVHVISRFVISRLCHAFHLFSVVIADNNCHILTGGYDMVILFSAASRVIHGA